MINAVRDGTAIIDDMHILTTSMMEQRHDPDFLIDGVEKRQVLIDEYDEWSNKYQEQRAVYERTPEAKTIVEKILGMDKVIAKTLGEFKTVAQQNVQNSNAQQKVIGYLGGSISASGSYMDFKK